MRKMIFKLDGGETIVIRPPKIKQYDKLLSASDDSDLLEAIADIAEIDPKVIYNNWTVDDLSRFYVEIQNWVNGVKASDPN